MATTNKTDARTMFFKGGALKREPLTLTIPGESDTLVVDIVSLSSGARGQLMSSCVKPGAGEGEDDSANEVDFAKIGPELIIASVMLPGTGTPLFDVSDRDALAAMDATFLDPIITKASTLSGLTKAAAKSAEKNSDGTADSVSGSPSPASSE